MILWVHESTLTTKSDEATCQAKSGVAGFSEDSVSELFDLLERTVEGKVNSIIIRVYNVDGSTLTTFQGEKKTRKSENGEM